MLRMKPGARLSRGLLPICVFLGILLVSMGAHGQVGTQGVEMPASTANDFDGVLGMDRNPASVGFLESAEGAIVLGRDRGAESVSLLMGSRFLGPLSLGVGGYFQGNGDSRFGGVLGLGSRELSLGAQFHGWVRHENSGQEEAIALDLGLTYRPSWWFSFASTLHHANSPKIGGSVVDPEAAFALSLRPGTDRMTLGMEMLIPTEDPALWVPQLSLMTTVLDGVHVGVAGRMVRGDVVEETVDVLPGDIPTVPSDTPPTEFTISGVLGLDWGSFGAFFGGTGNVSGGSGEDANVGGTVALRFSDEKRGKITRPTGAWVRISLGGLSERPKGSFFGRKAATLLRFTRYMEALGNDESVDGLVVSLRGYRGSWAQAQEVRNLFADFQKKGKKVVVYVAETNTLGYFVASQADTIMADPAGGVWLIGVSSSVLFYEELLSKVGVKGQAVRIGKFKSFPESFTRNTPSEELSLVKQTLTDGIYAEIVQGIAKARGKDPAEVEAWIEKGPYTANELKKNGLVDHVVHVDQLSKRLGKDLGVPVVLQKGFAPYSTRGDEWGERDQIAVVAITGTIVSGRSSKAPLLGYRSGAMTVGAILDKLARDPKVKAIVLRIDSPGGSALGSDKLYRKVRRVAKKKPVVISMGGVAASGGYFIAAAGDVIYADPTTITGSIGIFTTKFSFSGLFEWAGLSETIWKKGKNADLFAVSIPWTEEQETLIEGKLQQFYERFLQAVAKGRDMTRDEVHALAQGRVWLGTDAKKQGLVDEFGGLQEAIADAAKRGEISRGYDVVHFPKVSWQSVLQEWVTPSLPSLFVQGEDGASTAWNEEELVSVREEGLPELLHSMAEPLGVLRDLSAFKVGEALALMPFAYRSGD